MPTQFINPEGLFVSAGYTQVVAVAGKQTVYISGQVALNANGEIVNSDFAAQTRQVYENLTTALQAVGASFNDIVKTTTFVVNTDAEKAKIVREIRSQYQTDWP